MYRDDDVSLSEEVRFRADDDDKALLGIKAMASGRSEQDIMREILHKAVLEWDREYTIAERLRRTKGSAAETRGSTV
jgi:plasmid stability protein